MIIKLESYYDGEKYVCPAKDGGLKVNDIIKKVNNTKISTNEELKSEIEKSNGNEITVEIDRNGKTENKTVLPIKIPWEYISSVRGFVTAVQASEL